MNVRPTHVRTGEHVWMETTPTSVLVNKTLLVKTVSVVVYLQQVRLKDIDHKIICFFKYVSTPPRPKIPFKSWETMCLSLCKAIVM